jgi:arylsulfatase A-like enzyme
MKVGGHLCILLIAVGISACSRNQPPDEATPGSENLLPNIVLIVIDDMGYNDLGANGNPDITTPNLDRIASQGVRFTRHYVDSTCSPTRVGILTGTAPSNHGFRPAARGISPEVTTLPETLQAAGYSTHHIGKWHVGHTSKLAWPRQQGFDTFFGFLNQLLLKRPQKNGNFNYGRPTYLNPWLQSQNEPPLKYKGDLSEILVSRAVSLIDSKSQSGQPWFLNFWTYAPHAPVQPMKEFASKYADSPQGRYRALLEQVDHSVGRIVESLERNGLAESTLLIVASDNGGTNNEMDSNAPYFGKKGTFQEGGVRTPLLVRWPGKFPAGLVFDKTVSNLDYFPTIANAADAAVPGTLDGRDLLAAVESDSGFGKPLFWESSNSEVSGWGALSEDGRWRMSQYFVGEPVLNDLLSSPHGDRDVMAGHDEVARELHERYIDWRHGRRIVPVEYSRENAGGQATLSGSSLQRSPGFGGYTFAIGVTPNSTDQESGEEARREVIASQKNQWSMVLEGENIVVKVNGLRLEAPAPVPGRCSSLVFTSHFVFSPLYPKLNRAQLQLFTNGELAASEQITHPEIPVDDLLAPTYIGSAGNGQYPFRGVLSRPVIYNERVLAEGEHSPVIKNSVSDVLGELCPQV